MRRRSEESRPGGEQIWRKGRMLQIDVSVESLSLAESIGERPGVPGVAAGIDPAARSPESSASRHEKKHDFWQPVSQPEREGPGRRGFGRPVIELVQPFSSFT